MRMWMVDPEIMCQKHLCGEHVELHMFVSCLKKGNRVDGYLKNNCLEPRSIWQRHEALHKEMKRRGYKHASPINENDCSCILNLPTHQQHWMVNSTESLKELLRRCSKCQALYISKYGKIF